MERIRLLGVAAVAAVDALTGRRAHARIEMLAAAAQKKAPVRDGRASFPLTMKLDQSLHIATPTPHEPLRHWIAPSTRYWPVASGTIATTVMSALRVPAGPPFWS